MDKNFNYIANEFAVKYVGGENLDEFSKRVNEINTNCFLTFDDIANIKVGVLKGLLNDAYQSSNNEDIAKCCATFLQRWQHFLFSQRGSCLSPRR